VDEAIGRARSRLRVAAYLAGWRWRSGRGRWEAVWLQAATGGSGGGRR
jgi:hypothetical protein